MTTRETSSALDAVRLQRADLWHHLAALEHAIATPLPGRVEEWARHTHDALVDLAGTFERHCAVVEAPDGLFAEVLAAAPRLEGMVARLRDDHVDVSDTLTHELRAARALARDGGVDEALGSRERITDLIARISRHRQGGADLVYEAYAVDIGVGD